jgi:hypothetical protein
MLEKGNGEERGTGERGEAQPHAIRAQLTECGAQRERLVAHLSLTTRMARARR